MTNNILQQVERGFYIDNHPKVKSGRPSVYQRERTREIKRIKVIFKTNPNVKIFYGNGWVRLGNETFNGFNEEIIKKIIETTCKFANKVL